MADEDKKWEIAKRPEPTAPPVQGQLVRKLQLGPQQELDLTNLDLKQQGEIEAKFNQLAVERDDRRQRLKDDLTGTAAQLDIFSKAIGDATANNAAATIANTKTDSLGHTEMIMGNTDAARAGKLSRSQQGFSDQAWLWILLAIIVGVVVVLVAAFKR